MSLSLNAGGTPIDGQLLLEGEWPGKVLTFRCNLSGLDFEERKSLSCQLRDSTFATMVAFMPKKAFGLCGYARAILRSILTEAVTNAIGHNEPDHAGREYVRVRIEVYSDHTRLIISNSTQLTERPECFDTLPSGLQETGRGCRIIMALVRADFKGWTDCQVELGKFQLICVLQHDQKS